MAGLPPTPAWARSWPASRSGLAAGGRARPGQRAAGAAAADLADGALGIGVLLGYAPAASPEEYLRVAGLAAEAGVPTFTHARDLIEMVPGTLADGAEEIVRAAAETGAHMHYCHVNSTSQRHIDRVLALVARAQAAGSRVTTEAYPYGSGMTGIGAAFLAPERLGERGLSPSSLTYAPTGERVASAARLRELRQADPGGLVIIDLLSEDDPADRALLMRSLTFPGAVVASDAMPLTWTAPPADPLAWPLPPTAITHPRTAGTFSRALRLLDPRGAAHPRRPLSLGPGAGQVQPGAGPAAGGPGAGHAREGPAAGRARRRHRRVRSGDGHRPGQLPAQHAPVGRDPACPGQRHLRGAGRRHRGGRPAGPPGPGRAALTGPVGARAARAATRRAFERS